MIVRNESEVIRRCLDSVRPFITNWIIVDTGSTDGTQDIVRTHLSDVPGELHERPWKDFAHNRSEALALARPLADYTLIIDADDTLEVPQGFELGALSADAYSLDIRDDPLVYPRTQLVSNKLTWIYRGVLHEFITSVEPYSLSRLEIGIRRNHDGARRKNPDWFRRDAELLESALEKEGDPQLRSRYLFYLAQSYRDAGQSEEALRCYLERADLGGWQEEVFYSLYQAARIKENLERPIDEVLAAYDAATKSQPRRVEADYCASRLCRINGLYEKGYEVAKRSLARPLPTDALFGEPWVYQFGLLDEMAVNAYWTNRHKECLEACLTILEAGRLPPNDLQRVASNASHAWRKIVSLDASPALPESATVRAKRSSIFSGGSTNFGRTAVITPYYKEDISVLWQCHSSVLAQSGNITHFMIADGFPNDTIDEWKVRHVVLPTSHGDNGNAARAVGSLLAQVEGFEFIAYLDADNWFHEDHLASLFELHLSTGAEVCCAKRTFHCLDGTMLKGAYDPDEERQTHVDTSCYFIQRRGFRVLDVWASMPRNLSPICDRVFLSAIRERGLRTAFSGRPTVAFRSQYKNHYISAGITPPDGLKENVGVAEWKWLSTADGVRESVQALGFCP